jgi:hypothetical protein
MVVETLDIVLPGNKNGYVIHGPHGLHKNRQGRVIVYHNKAHAEQIKTILEKQS